MRGLTFIVLALLLAGCNQGGAITCPTLKGYSSAFMKSAARELDGLDQTTPHLVQMLNDYGVERDAIRECLKFRNGGLAFVATAFAQDDAEAAKAQWRHVADQLRPKVPKLSLLIDDAETDVLAYTSGLIK